MSQKKNRLIKAFLHVTGLENTGRSWLVRVGETKNGKMKQVQHIIRDDKLVKKIYAAANAKEKYELTKQMSLAYIKLAA